MQYPKLVDRNKEMSVALEKKERELVKEIAAVKKQVDQGDQRVKELGAIIVSELSAKLKAVVKINQ